MTLLDLQKHLEQYKQDNGRYSIDTKDLSQLGNAQYLSPKVKD